MVHIRYALDDWYFARDFVHRARPQVDARLDHLARELVRIVRDTDADEIVVDGHSLGAPLSLVVLDRALQLDPQLGSRGKPLHLVSSGSSLLKVALHPAAAWLREAVGRVANAPSVYWVEYQALVDVINVYKVDPVVALGLAATGKPIVQDHSHPYDGGGAHLPALSPQFPAHPPPGGDGQRAALFLRLLHAVLRTARACPTGSIIRIGGRGFCRRRQLDRTAP